MLKIVRDGLRDHQLLDKSIIPFLFQQENFCVKKKKERADPHRSKTRAVKQAQDISLSVVVVVSVSPSICFGWMRRNVATLAAASATPSISSNKSRVIMQLFGLPSFCHVASYVHVSFAFELTGDKTNTINQDLQKGEAFAPRSKNDRLWVRVTPFNASCKNRLAKIN